MINGLCGPRFLELSVDMTKSRSKCIDQAHVSMQEIMINKAAL